jgi:hypothetical protein
VSGNELHMRFYDEEEEPRYERGIYGACIQELLIRSWECIHVQRTIPNRNGIGTEVPYDCDR